MAKDDRQPVAVFYNPRYPNERVLYRDEQDAPPMYDVQFDHGRLAVYDEDTANWLRRTLLPRNDVFEGTWDEAVTCDLCKNKGREPTFLNGKALVAHMKLWHE